MQTGLGSADRSKPCLNKSRRQVGAFFNIYLEYCYGYENGLRVCSHHRRAWYPLLTSPPPAVQVLAARKRQDKDVGTWFDQKQKQTKPVDVRNQPVEAFLIMPVQRLLRWPPSS